ncbi:hypothetical protein I6N90_04465 [Paenibacillus sp. GSMTC-2017]|uniref:hypothetical protein n=1 Tax=Paenibacillus sp. GSMTC-2017 TaxID=2794350 RepID=UPI0018D8425A|nr:hypothetical protein [Paenibacillus sp. GSMTC-2017]MBH5317061.1 hypothetical protein [Paenibacillus sp. GSMTC-2017]
MKKKSHLKKITISLLSIAIVVIGYLIVGNKLFNKRYDRLNETDRTMFAQLNELYTNTANTKEALWRGYQLNKLPIILVAKGNSLNNSSGTFNAIRRTAYTVGISGLADKWYTQKITMPDHFTLQNVYRLSALTPGVGSTWNPIGNFSTFGENISLGDATNAYYFKYNNKNLENPIKESQYFIPFLIHENFHHSVQLAWKSDSGDVRIEEKNAEWFEYLGYQFAALDGIKDAIVNNDKEAMKRAVAEYVVISEYRKQQDIHTYSSEKLHETLEGTATYVGIKASTHASTPPLLLLPGAPSEEQRNFSYFFTSIAHHPGYLSEIKWNRYESGALLCFALDKLLEDQSWQQKLNAQKSNSPVTIYDLVEQYYDEHGLKEYANSVDTLLKKYDTSRIRKESKLLDNQI